MKNVLFNPMRLRLLSCLAFVMALAICVHATVTNVAWYRLGENDPGAANGLAVTNTTDLMGFENLKQFGSPLYTNSVSTSASNNVGSSLAVQFNGTSQYLSNGVVSTAVDNFGIEAWAKPNTTNAGVYIIAYNGFATGGWGLYQSGNTYSALLGGVTVLGAGSAATGTWAHVALVRDNGTSTLYVNSVAAGTSTNAPHPATGGFALGTPPQSPTFEFFSGTMDEVRVFTFAAGQFSTNDLLVNLQRVTTLAATEDSATSATLNGGANPSGLSTSAWFEWGTTTNYGNVTSAQLFGGSAGSTNFSQVVTGLVGGVTYNFHAVVSNSLGLALGTNQSFSIPVFALAITNLPGVCYSAVAWGDYDNDGRLDILLTGATNFYSFPGSGIAQVWRNTGNGFSNINAGLPGVSFGAVAWGDYDNDGLLDILLTGVDTNGQVISQVWRNTGSGFTNINAGLPGVSLGAVAWGDYDNDGLLDILLTGLDTNGQFISQVWRNTGNGFVNINAGLPGVAYNSVAWGDYDNDGRLDILLAGITNTLNNGFPGVAEVWRNTGSGFTNINAGLPGIWYGSSAWGDYDNDGRLDVLLTGSSNSDFSADTELWRNTGSGFTPISTGLPGIMLGSIAWGDYDNDGQSDIAFIGATDLSASGITAGIWRNTGSGFTNLTGTGLPGTEYGSLAWGDYDNDGRLDILVTGATGFDTNSNPGGFISQVWRNTTPLTNTPPATPTGLSVTPSGTTMVFSWNAASDAQTPASGLTYNLRVGTTPGGGDLVGPMAASSGLRRLPQMGNMQHTLSHTISGLPLGQPLYWSVQAVDNAFAGSPFAAEQSFAFNTVLAPPSGIPVPGDINGDGVVDQSELNLVLSNYYSYSPWLYMTNVAGLGGTNVTFALSNSTAGAFSVEYSTDLVDWQFLGPATPRYLFTDTNAPAIPQRFYRLRWP